MLYISFSFPGPGLTNTSGMLATPRQQPGQKRFMSRRLRSVNHAALQCTVITIDVAGGAGGRGRSSGAGDDPLQEGSDPLRVSYFSVIMCRSM